MTEHDHITSDYEVNGEAKPLLVLFAGEMKSQRMWDSFTPDAKELFDFVTIDPHIPEADIDIPANFERWTPAAKAQWKFEWTMNHVGEDKIFNTLINHEIPVANRRIILSAHDIVTTTKDSILEKPKSLEQLTEEFLPLYEKENIGVLGAWYLEEYGHPQHKGILLYEYDGIYLAGSSDQIRQELHDNPALVERSMKNAGGWSLAYDYWAGTWSGRMYIGDGVHDSFNPQLRDYSENSVQEREQMIYGTQGQILQALFDSSKELLPPFGVIYERSKNCMNEEENEQTPVVYAEFTPDTNHPIINGLINGLQ